jgi:hypothetical protein
MLEKSAPDMEPDSSSTFSQEIASQFNPAHIDTSYMCNIHSNIIRPYKSCKMSVSVKFSIRILYVFYMCVIGSILFSLFPIIQIMTLFIDAVYPSTRYILSLQFKVSSVSYFRTPLICSLINLKLMTVKNTCVSAVRHSVEVLLCACVVGYAVCCMKVAERLSTEHGVPRWLRAGWSKYNRMI